METMPTEMQMRKRKSVVRLSLLDRKAADAAMEKVSVKKV